MRSTTRSTVVDNTYLKLVRAFPLRRITSATQHARAKQVILNLSRSHSDSGTRDYVDVLVDLIADYEKRSSQSFDTSSVTAAQLVRHRLEERAMTVSALAKQIGIPQPHLSAMLNARRDWSKSAIRALSKMFNIRAERFLV